MNGRRITGGIAERGLHPCFGHVAWLCWVLFVSTVMTAILG
jgi:hypothetical protein